MIAVANFVDNHLSPLYDQLSDYETVDIVLRLLKLKADIGSICYCLKSPGYVRKIMCNHYVPFVITVNVLVFLSS